ncbi:hypothetical protein CHGG_10811 [Chaetomium globosum CBS 148.51]|uniref:DUF3237 domain-containing protein n=1 Tax=Chaetomium globosum (strain ATCC 6205 / CBS 148.51 / DSM 1962 / NBRC 6347 / NRRL 1970) TaxID=306901 RepID=Q2GMJ3_CHAGB|nr:uncharacterized protein CHGG_10811 [Chaetomium globosum CBS 148.51]EAQ82993.1 hypothetical protein CHGG_10811 [Chaetomium globosum CBS 148.51]
MKQTFLTLFYCLVALLGVGSAAGDRKPHAPKAPGLTYLYTVNITAGEIYPVGPGPRGIRLVVPIASGNFAGPRLKGGFMPVTYAPKRLNTSLTPPVPLGTVMPMGGDWALTDGRNANGSLTVDVRQTFKTDDGAFIQVFETGQLQPDGRAFVRLGFETGSTQYEWLNTVVALGIIRSVGTDGITIDTWQMVAP